MGVDKSIPMDSGTIASVITATRTSLPVLYSCSSAGLRYILKPNDMLDIIMIDAMALQVTYTHSR